jgi:hypothetical protein
MTVSRYFLWIGIVLIVELWQKSDLQRYKNAKSSAEYWKVYENGRFTLVRLTEIDKANKAENDRIIAITNKGRKK